MDKQHEQHLEKYGWVEAKSAEAAVMLIESAKKDENGFHTSLQSWSYTVRNQLMYVPDGHDNTSLMPPPPPGPPKEILHRNTRVTASPNPSTAAAVRKGDREAVWSMMATSDRQILSMRKAEREGGKVDLADFLGTPQAGASPQVRGYGFVATPSPAPGVDMSPMTTWGRLDGTPLLIDPTDTPLDLTPGPSFKVPEPPRREELAMRLADKAKESQKSKARAYAASPYARPSATTALSPAGRSLMASKLSSKRGIVGADVQLRASYNSPAVGGKSATRGLNGIATPSPLPTPSPSPRAPKAPTPSHHSITDNLLDTPASSSAKKGKSITDDLLI